MIAEGLTPEIEGTIVPVAQHIEGRGESGNSMFDLSVSALACWRGGPVSVSK